MRRPATLVAALVALVAPLAAVLLVAAAAPALAGGPTSVLVVNYDGARAAAALTGSAAYDELVLALASYEQPAGETLPAATFMETRIRLTWMVHDVTPWRIDAVVVDGADVWVETTMDSGDGKSLFESPTIRHRPKDAHLLLATLTSLGVLGETTPSGTASSASSGSSDPVRNAAGTTAPATPTAGSAAPTGPPWWATVAAAVLALGLGLAVGRRGRSEGGATGPATREPLPSPPTRSGQRSRARRASRLHERLGTSPSLTRQTQSRNPQPSPSC